LLVSDVTVFTWNRIPFAQDGEIENIFALHPDWTIEILSPVREALTKSIQNATKVISNILHCLRYGTQLGWFIDPESRSVLTFFPGQQPIELTDDNQLPVPDYIKLNLSVNQMFSWLKAGS